MTAPFRGLGIFLRGLNPANVSRTAIGFKEAGASVALLMAESNDGSRPKPDVIASYASALRDVADCRIWIWTFPGRADLATMSALYACELAEKVSADGICLDVEVAFKQQKSAARDLVATAIDGIKEGRALAVSSYPIAAFHPTMPWAEMSAGLGWPQIYDTAGDRKLARRAISEWRTRHGGVAFVSPTLAAYESAKRKDGAGQLWSDFQNVCLDDAGKCDVPGVTIWSDPSLDHKEREVCARIAGLLRGVP